MKIIVDAFGGDNAPVEIVKGAVAAINNSPDVTVVLTGKQKEIEAILSECVFNNKQIEIIDCSDVITNDDVPTVAIKEKTQSSLVVAIDRLKSDDEIKALVSAGSTGAVLAGSLLRLGRINGIKRPALAPLLPTIMQGHVMLVDCGANVDCKPEYLCQFAVMGTAYMKYVYGIENPKVGLLSNGTEDKKGNELTKAAFQLLKETPNIHFVGNIEARDNLSGKVDVIVCDGFAGNIALKASEGVSELVFSCMKEEIYKSALCKFGAMLMKPALRRVKKRMDYNQAGGAIFLGVEKIVIKSHGSSRSVAICNSILQAKAMADAGIIEHIKAAVSK